MAWIWANFLGVKVLEIACGDSSRRRLSLRFYAAGSTENHAFAVSGFTSSR
jgi:hypothetical protein